MKIAEGCANHCSYCVIPSIRGTLRSRSLDSVVAEVENLTQKTILKLRNADGTPAFASRGNGAGAGNGKHHGAGCCGGGNGAQTGPMDGTGPNPNCPKKS